MDPAGRETYVFSEDNFRNPDIPSGLAIHEVPLALPLMRLCRVLGIISSPDELTAEKGNFEIVKWPVSGWRQLDPKTGDEAGD